MSQPEQSAPSGPEPTHRAATPAEATPAKAAPDSASLGDSTPGSAPVSSATAPDESSAGEGDSTDRILVGHDGSPSADSALELALEISEKMDVPLLVIRSWTIDSAPHGALFSHGYVSTFDEVSALIRENLIKDAGRFVTRHPAAEVHYFSTLGQPAQTLLKLSKGARMLVVGSRGRGGFASLMLGSVSEQCVRHAGCPVLVSRPRVAAAPSK